MENRFQIGSGVYKCCICEKQTRDTGRGEADVEMCAYCYECSGQDNANADGVYTREEFLKVLADLGKEYGRDDYKPWSIE